MVHVYVLQCPRTGRRYTGITNSLARRGSEHRSRSSKGSERLNGTFEIIHTEGFASYPDARSREKFLKSGQGRAWLSVTYPFDPDPKSRV